LGGDLGSFQDGGYFFRVGGKVFEVQLTVLDSYHDGWIGWEGVRVFALR
jgi:hypothetical protein